MWRNSLAIRGDKDAGNRVGGMRRHGSTGDRIDLYLGVAMIGDDERRTPGNLNAPTIRPRQASTVSMASITAGMTPVCPTMSPFAKFTTMNR